MADVDIPQAVALKGVPDVELVAVGSWNASTGPVTITTEDIHEAVAALECPGVHNPVLKLGHQEPDPDGQKIRWDGEPAVGWISNMRLSDNSAKILGDYTGVPAWLVDVMPSAYPQRSVEITRDFVCQIGHTHPFVITAVSLLGVYPPAVGVIKSLNDVQALYTLAAADHGHPPAEVVRSIEITLAAGDSDQRRALTDDEIRSTVDFGRDRDEWEAAIAALLAAWPQIGRAQRDELTAQISSHVAAGELDKLAGMRVDSQAAADLMYDVMHRAAREAADEQLAEARRQGVIVDADVTVDDAWIRDAAAGIAATMAASLAATAGRDAAQLTAPGIAGWEVAAVVDEKLKGLSDRFLRDQFAGAVGAARSAGRYAVLSVAPQGRYQAAEVNDTRTCSNCKSIDGTVFESLDEAVSAYGSGGYQQCSGGGRCRGRYITIWEVDTAPVVDAVVPSWMFTARIPTTVSLSSGGSPMPLPTTIKAKVSAEDISRAYYKTAGYSNWITAMHVDPLELVVCDDSSGDYFRVPVTLSGDDFEFGEPVQVAVEYVDVKTPSSGSKTKATAMVYAADGDASPKLSAFAWADRKTALDVVGGEPETVTPAAEVAGRARPLQDQLNAQPNTFASGGVITEPAVAPDVSPAGVAIRKMAAATQTPPAAPAAGGSVSTTEQEASGMPFDAAKLREALGLSETASADDALTAFAGALSALGGGQTPTTAPAPTAAPANPELSAGQQPTPPVVPRLADGDQPVLLDRSLLAQLQESAKRGETAWAQLRRNERDGVLDEAIRLGKFPASRRDYWVQLWDKDPDGTRDAVAALAANVIPVLSAGYLGDDTAQRSAADTAYEGLFGKEN